MILTADDNVLLAWNVLLRIWLHFLNYLMFRISLTLSPASVRNVILMDDVENSEIKTSTPYYIRVRQHTS